MGTIVPFPRCYSTTHHSLENLIHRYSTGLALYPHVSVNKLTRYQCTVATPDLQIAKLMFTGWI
jgi:hypothetical protein